VLALGVDDARPAHALCLGLLGNRADHALVDVDMLDLDVGDLDAPLVGLVIEDLLDIAVELVPLGQHLVQLVLAEHRSQRRLGQLAGGERVVLDPVDGLLGLDHPEVDHGVHLDRDVVARDDVLGRHVLDDGA
jgi:hypothetical protein